jgi:hypothetical protein
MLIDKNALINENYAIKDLEKIMRNNLKQIYRKYFS